MKQGEDSLTQNTKPLQTEAHDDDEPTRAFAVSLQANLPARPRHPAVPVTFCCQDWKPQNTNPCARLFSRL